MLGAAGRCVEVQEEDNLPKDIPSAFLMQGLIGPK